MIAVVAVEIVVRTNAYLTGSAVPIVRKEKPKFADPNLSSTELESGSALGAFLQTPAPILDKISGPMGAQILSSTGLGFDNLIERAQVFQVPALDKIGLPQIHI